MDRKALTCPICNGKGWKEMGIFTMSFNDKNCGCCVSAPAKEECISCKGKGYIIV